MPTLQLKVLSSAHLEKDFTLLINAMGIIPNQYDYDGQLGIEHGPRRQEYDGYTYFGVEDGNKHDDDEEEDSKDGHGATGGFIEDASGMQVPKRLMNDFLIPMNNPNVSGDISKDNQPSMNSLMGGAGNNHQGRQFYI